MKMRRGILILSLLAGLVWLGFTLNAPERAGASGGFDSTSADISNPWLGPISPGSEWVFRGYGSVSNEGLIFVSETQEVVSGVTCIRYYQARDNNVRTPKRGRIVKNRYWIAQDATGDVRFLKYKNDLDAVDNYEFTSSIAASGDSLILFPAASTIAVGQTKVFYGRDAGSAYTETTVIRSTNATVVHPGNGFTYTNCVAMYETSTYSTVGDTVFFAPGIGAILIQYDTVAGVGSGFFRTNIPFSTTPSTSIKVLLPGSGPNALQVAAIAADGVASVRIEFTLSGDGTLTLAVPTGDALEGKVGSSGSAVDAPASTSWTTSASTTSTRSSSDTSYKASIHYRAPDDFNKDSAALDTATSRLVTLTGTFTPSGGSAVPVTVTLNIVRPPLVLVHGLWSNARTWNDFVNHLGKSLAIVEPFQVDPYLVNASSLPLSQRLIVAKVDYSHYSGQSFDFNKRVVRNNIQTLLTYLRKNGIAVRQIDYVGHSMGGILGRMIAPDKVAGLYGIINKLVTVHTPHLGSGSATALKNKASSISNLVLLGTHLGQMFGAIPQGNLTADTTQLSFLLTGGAVADLETTSTAIRNLPAIDEKIVHLISGELGTTRILTDPHIYGFIALDAILEVIPPVQRVLFVRTDWDAIVSGVSQRSNLSTGSGVSSPTTFEHTEAPKGSSTVNTVLTLLNSSLSSTFFTTLAANSTINFNSLASSLSASGMDFGGSNATIQNQARFKIMSPANASTSISGQTINVAIFADTASFVPETVTISGSWNPDTFSIDFDSPFTMGLTIDTSFVGTARIYASGFDHPDTTYLDSITITVLPKDSLAALTVNPAPLTLAKGESMQLSVFGLFGSDTTTPKYLTGQSVILLSYASESTSVATVDSNGIIYGVANGFTQITITSGDTSTTVGLTVQEAEGSSGSTTNRQEQACVISRMTENNTLLAFFRWFRDIMLESAIGCWLTGLYYSL